MATKWAVRIENSQREHWDTVPATSETDARIQAARFTDVNRSWTAYVKCGSERVAKYKRGAPVKRRAPKAEKTPATPPAQPSALGTASLDLLWCVPVDMQEKARGLLASLVSEVRAEEREACATLAHSAMLKSTQWGAKVVLADVVRDAIRARR